MKKKEVILIVLIGVFFIFVIIGVARNVAKRDVEYINKITDVEHMEKAGESIGKASSELKSRKDAFLKGYNSKKEKQ